MIFSKLDKLSTRDKIFIVIAVGMLIALAVDHFVVSTLRKLWHFIIALETRDMRQF